MASKAKMRARERSDAVRERRRRQARTMVALALGIQQHKRADDQPPPTNFAPAEPGSAADAARG